MCCKLSCSLLNRVMTISDRLLRPGIDYPIWARQKLSRALQHGYELDATIRTWFLTMPEELSADISPNRLSVSFRARVPFQAPLFEWSLLAGDVLHNYCAALDALTWGMAHLDDATPSPSHLRKIHYPNFASEDQWSRAIRGPLKTIPKYVQERFRSLQPFANDKDDVDVIRHLHQLDIDDKHKGLLRFAAKFANLQSVMFSVELEGGLDFSKHVVRGPWAASVDSSEDLKDGTCVFSLETDVPIVSASSPRRVDYNPVISIEGKYVNVFSFLGKVETRVQEIFGMVEKGPASAA